MEISHLSGWKGADESNSLLDTCSCGTTPTLIARDDLKTSKRGIEVRYSLTPPRAQTVPDLKNRSPRCAITDTSGTG